MNTKRTLANVLCGTLLIAPMVIPSAYAAEQSETSNTTVEQRADSSAVTDARLEGEGFRQDVRDATLTARVKTQLLLNTKTSGLKINVDSDKGVVTLKGTVNSQEEGNLAATIARNTEGARSVTDKLKIEG